MAVKVLCSIPSCDKVCKTRGFCDAHYRRLLKYGSDFDRSPIGPKHGPVCAVTECSLPSGSRGFCVGHYTRFLRQGDDFDRSPIDHREESGLDVIERALREAVPDKCWEWPLHQSKSGYGEVTINRVPLRAHRVVCGEAHGPPPSRDHFACHSCDNPACINKYHLRWDTHAGNIADRQNRGRQLKGERHHKAKLTETDVREIRKRIASGENNPSIARAFNVSAGTVWYIRNGIHWRHVA